MSPPHSVPVIGLVGGIGSGKSAVARWLAEKRPVALINADEIGHAILNDPHIRAKLRQHFGEKIFDSHGQVDRSALAARVFGDRPAQLAARRQLEEIVHPEILQAIQETIRNIRASENVEAILLDAAVLLEAGWENVCDTVVFVEAPRAIRRQRVARSRGWSAEELEKREASQLQLHEKQQRADFVIHNEGSLEKAGKELEGILNRITQPNVDSSGTSQRGRTRPVEKPR